MTPFSLFSGHNAQESPPGGTGTSPRLSLSVVLVAVASGLVSFIVYFLTILPEADWADSSEMALQAYQLGVTHPPGAPLHSMLGYLFGAVIPDAALASNLLSATATSAVVIVLVCFAWRLTRNLGVSAGIAALYAFSPRLWTLAVTTEVYNLNALLFALALFAMYHWHRNPSRSRLTAAAVVFGLSLAVYLANVLLLPVLLYLIWQSGPARVQRSLQYLAVTGMSILPFLLFVILRSENLPPLGTSVLPLEFADMISFFSAQQYESTGLMSPMITLGRIVQHAGILSHNVFYVGLLFGGAGLHALWKGDRKLFWLLALILVVNLGYFTCINSYSDYYMMVTPAHFTFALFMAIGAAQLASARKALRIGVPLLLAVTASAMLVLQMPERLQRSASTPVQDFVLSTFDVAPRNAIVISAWGEFTPLLFFQTTTLERPDLRFVERNNEPRHYLFGTISSSDDYIEQIINTRPVIIDRVDDRLRARYDIRILNTEWKQLLPRVVY
jgi:hypothetical protein